MKARITGTGRAVPERVLTNADLERMVDTSDEWITGRTGIKERRIAAPGQALTDFAVPACERALEMAGVKGSDVGLVLCATVSPDRVFPAAACTVQEAIGAHRAPAFDMSAACTGFVYALGVAARFIEGGGVRHAVVVGGEVLSQIVDWDDRATCVLFGDGAGAVVLSATEREDRGVLAVAMHADGSLGDLIERPGGGSRHPVSSATLEEGLQYLRMRGNETFKVAVRSLAEVSEEALAQCGRAPEDVDWFIPHQANRRIIDAVGERLAIRQGRTYVNIDRYGNTSAASIPIALDELNRGDRLEDGHLVLMSAFGSGLTWGAAAVRW